MFEVIWQVMRVGNIGVMRAWWSHPFSAGFFFYQSEQGKTKTRFILFNVNRVSMWVGSVLTFSFNFLQNRQANKACYFLILQVSASEFPHMNNYQVSSCCDVWLFGTALNTFCLQTWWNNASYTLDYYKHMPVHFKSTLFFPKASLIAHFSDQFSLCTWKFSRPWLEETESCILLALPGLRLLFTSHMHCYNPVWWCRSDVSWPFKGKSPHTT